MTPILGVVQIGLVLAIVFHGLALCVLYVRVTKLTKFVSRGGGVSSLLGFEVPQLKAIDARTGEVVTFEKNETAFLCMLIVSSGCLLCQQLLHSLRRQTIRVLKENKDLELVIYCRGSLRGSLNLLLGLESRIVTLVAHDIDLVSILPIQSVPALLTTDRSGKVIRHSYPFSVDDIFAVVSDIKEKPEAVAV